MAALPTPGGPISYHERNCEMAKYCPIDGLTIRFHFVLLEETTLAHKLELQEGLPTLYCLSNLYGCPALFVTLTFSYLWSFFLGCPKTWLHDYQHVISYL